MRFLISLLLIGAHLLPAAAQTFSSTVNEAIPDDGSTVMYNISVSGLPTVIDTFFGLERVCLNLGHTYTSDMTVKLQAPNGKVVMLFAGVGGAGQNFFNTCLEGSGQSITTGAAPFSDTYQSQEVLGNINKGQDPNGVWTLILHDTYAFADAGFLIDWSIQFGENPAQPFTFISSNLPIVKFTTLNEPIGDDPKVPVLMQIIDNGGQIRNNAAQTDYAYEGVIMTEWQGFTGPYYPKKNYAFETVDASGNDLDTTILGMPRESDWIFKAEYLDHTLLKNSIAYEMARRMGGYAPRTRPCELMLDGEYIGLYMLTEKVKRDKNRIDIAKLTPSDTTGSDLSGGYIIEMNINNNPGDWLSPYPPINDATCDAPVEFKHVYPKSGDLKPVQRDYIRQFVQGFEDALLASDFADTSGGYRQYIDVSAFIDFLIVNEFSVNFDSYGRSTYLYKEKDTDGGKLKCGPPWDYDRAMDYYVPETATNGWVWQITHPYWPFPFWWSRMWEDVAYRQQLVCRWQSLRENTLSTPAFMALVDALQSNVQEGQERNFRVWNDLGFMPYEGHIGALKAYLTTRLAWIDATLAEAVAVDADFSTQAVSSGTLSFVPNDLNALGYLWQFGDGSTSTNASPTHTYLAPGTYTVTCTVFPGTCLERTATTSVNILAVSTTSPAISGVSVFPNPFVDKLQVDFGTSLQQPVQVRLENGWGQTVVETALPADVQNHQIATEKLPSGVYFVHITTNNGNRQTLRLVRQ
jgi:subtilisin-like proprotein convertase family protein